MLTSSYYKLIIAVVITVSLASLAYFSLSLHRRGPISCDASLSLLNKDQGSRWRLSFFADNGEGIISINNVPPQQKSSIEIIRPFTYREIERNTYILKSRSSGKEYGTPDALSGIDDVLPLFFTENKKDVKMAVRIIRVKNSGWLFLSGNTPYFFCENGGQEKSGWG